MHKITRLAGLAMCSAPIVPAWASPPALPATRAEPLVEQLHGADVADPFRWLEGDNSNPEQMGRPSPEVTAWTDAQNAHTRSILDNLPGRKELEEKMRPLMMLPSVSAPIMRGQYYFYTRREGAQAQPVWYVRDGANAAPRVILDPAKLDPTGLTAVGEFAPSQDGTLIAYGTFKRGDENTTVYVMGTDNGKDMGVVIPGRVNVIEWLPDNSGFFYRSLADVNDPYSGLVRFHKLGTDPKNDPILFRQFTKEENEKLATTWGPGATVSKDGRWMILYYWTSTSSNDIWAIDLTKWFQDGTFEKREIMVGAPNTFFGDVVGDTLLMTTDYKAPNKRVVAINLAGQSLGEQAWTEVIPESKTAVLQGVGVAKGVLAANYEERATTLIKLYGLNGDRLGDLRLPGLGSAGLSVSDDRTEAYLSYTSFNYPNTIFRVDLAKPTGEPTVWERPNVPVDPESVEVKQVTYSSKDGTPVTMFLVHKKGLELNGNNPVILYGYGGFNINMNPFFSATMFPWFEAGGVFAMPNLRGGGEYGKEWHEAGMLGNKQNVFDDFIAAGEWLIANNYTNKDRIAISGGSNGGLLTGAMVVQRPDLFRAAIVDVPLLDMLRYQKFLMARYWVPEYGDPANPEHFGFLRAYSPYHNIKQGVRYPAVFVTAGENDARTHPMHARKFGAALQAAVANVPDARPVLFWADRDAGHGGGKPLELRIRDAVDRRIFIMWQLGMLPRSGADAGGMMATPTALASVRTVKLHVDGMVCQLCVGTVKQTLAKLPGVERVDVSLEAKEATVTLAQNAQADAAQLAKAFEGTKFKATP